MPPTKSVNGSLGEGAVGLDGPSHCCGVGALGIAPDALAFGMPDRHCVEVRWHDSVGITLNLSCTWTKGSWL